MATKEDLEDLFLIEKPTGTVVKIRRRNEECYASQISSEIDTTYSHTVKLLNKLEEKELVKRHKEGRKNLVELTEEGKNIADKLIELLDEMKTDNLEDKDIFQK